MNSDPSFNANLDAIRLRFLSALSERLDDMEAIRDGLDSGPKKTALEAIQFGAHKTVGVAATLGFADLGDLSQRAEVMIADYLAGAPDAQSYQDILDATDDMLGEMALVAETARPGT
ncbi:Hpt domain-containing protein [Actibacterium sp. D379-3]